MKNFYLSSSLMDTGTSNPKPESCRFSSNSIRAVLAAFVVLFSFNFAEAQAPANDDLANATVVNCGDVVAGDTNNATLDEDDAPDLGADMDSPNVWYSFTGNGSPQTVTLSTCNDADFDTGIIVYTGTSGNLTAVAGEEDTTGCNGYTTTVDFSSDGTTTYYITVNGWGATDVGLFNLTVTCEALVYDCPTLNANIGDSCDDNNANTANDVITDNCECAGIVPPLGSACENAIVVSSLPYDTTGNTADYGDNYAGSPGADCGSTSSYLNGDDVVYSYTNSTNGNISLNLSATPTATYAGMFIYDSCDAIGNTCAVVGDYNGSNSDELVIDEVSVASNSTIYIVISTWATPQSTEFTLNITENSCTSPTYASTIVPNCDNDEYSVAFEVTNLGTATSLDLSDGTANEAITSLGTYTFGPYASGSTVDFTLNGDDANCNLTFSEDYTCPLPPPANDDCSNATSLTIGTEFSTNVLVGTNEGATDAGITSTCNGEFGGEVWYSVQIPASGNVTLEVNGVEGSDLTDTVLTVYSGTCDALVEAGCDDDSSESGAHPLLNLTGQTPGDLLYVAVYEYGNDAFGEFQVSAYDTIVVPTCDTPTTLAVTGLTDTTATFTWAAANDGDNNFEVVYALSGETPVEANAVAVSELSYAFTDLAAETAYVAYVRTVCSADLSSEWAEIAFSTIASEEPVCGDPVNLTATDVTISSANLSWTAVGDVSDFEVIIVEDGVDPSTGTSNNVAGTTYDASGLDSNTTYDYYVRALCSDNLVSSWAMNSFTTLEEAVCADPTNVMVSDITETTANFTWSSAGDELAWDVIIEEAGVVVDENSGMTVDAMSYEASGLQSDTEYTFYVRAQCATDFVSAYTAINFTTEGATTPEGCFAPTNVVVTNITATSISVSYELPVGALLDGKAGTAAVQVINPRNNRLEVRDYDGTSITMNNLTPNQDYFWVLRSDCGADDVDVSPWSEIYEASTLPVDLRNVFARRTRATLYPNPATDVVRINDVNAASVLIYDFNGTQVRSFNTTNNSFDVTGLPTGQYTIKIIDADGNAVSSRLLKQ